MLTWLIGAAIAFAAGYFVACVVIGWHEEFNRRPHSDRSDVKDIVRSAKATALQAGVAAAVIWTAIWPGVQSWLHDHYR